MTSRSLGTLERRPLGHELIETKLMQQKAAEIRHTVLESTSIQRLEKPLGYLKEKERKRVHSIVGGWTLRTHTVQVAKCNQLTRAEVGAVRKKAPRTPLT